jgi:hypothetical protein
MVESFIENFNRHAIKVDQHLTADQWLASTGARPGTADGLYAAYAAYVTYVTAIGHAESRGMLSPDDFKAWFQTASHRQRPVDPDRVRSTLRDILQYKASDGLPTVDQRRQTATLRSLSAARRHATTKASKQIFEVAAKAAPTDSPLASVLERENAFLDSLFKTHHNVGGTDSNEENRDKYPFVYWSVMLVTIFEGASCHFIINSVFLIIIYFISPKRLRKPNDKKFFMLISVIITLIDTSSSVFRNKLKIHEAINRLLVPYHERQTCKKLLAEHNITETNYKEWMLKNHPTGESEKKEANELCQKVNSCFQTLNLKREKKTTSGEARVVESDSDMGW